MTKNEFSSVFIELSMSLDGYIAGPDDNMEHRLGTHGGSKVFDWYTTGKETYPKGTFFKAEAENRAVVDQAFARTGAFVSGRRTYDLAKGWGGRHPFGVPVFILTHRPDPNPPQGESNLTFVSDGIESAIEKAKSAARGRDVSLSGGASPGQQALAAGLVDELVIHISPLLIGGGVRLFDRLGEGGIELELMETVGGPKVSPLRYRVLR